MDSRVEYQGNIGTVRYEGVLQHYSQEHKASMQPEDVSQVYLGIEWDDVSRGRHNGTVGGFKYFQTKKNENSGTMLKIEKANRGINLMEALRMKYFKSKEEFETTIQELKSGQYKQLTHEDKQITEELDEDCYFDTVKKHKKAVQFYGFDKIWSKINNLNQIKEVSLQNMSISYLGQENLGSIFTNIREMALEGNLFNKWSQVQEIGQNLPTLELLTISRNKLQVDDFDIDNSVFKNLRIIGMNSVDLNWANFCKISRIFKNVEQLIANQNFLNDPENIQDSFILFDNLKFLSLENNNISDFSGFIDSLKYHPNLERISLSFNPISSLEGIQFGFKSLKFLMLESNKFADFKVLRQISYLPKLENLRFTKQLVHQNYSADYVWQRAVAETQITIINGFPITKVEKRDCEYFYMRNTFETYFQKTCQKDYDYDFSDFKQHCEEFHPRVLELIQLYGNPFEVTPKLAEQNQQKNYVQLILAIKDASKPQVKKKFPINTTIQVLKNIASKLFKMSQDNLTLTCQFNETDCIVLDNIMKNLQDYALYDDCIIICQN